MLQLSEFVRQVTKKVLQISNVGNRIHCNVTTANRQCYPVTAQNSHFHWVKVVRPSISHQFSDRQDVTYLAPCICAFPENSQLYFVADLRRLWHFTSSNWMPPALDLLWAKTKHINLWLIYQPTKSQVSSFNSFWDTGKLVKLTFLSCNGPEIFFVCSIKYHQWPCQVSCWYFFIVIEIQQ